MASKISVLCDVGLPTTASPMVPDSSGLAGTLPVFSVHLGWLLLGGESSGERSPGAAQGSMALLLLT